MADGPSRRDLARPTLTPGHVWQRIGETCALGSAAPGCTFPGPNTTPGRVDGLNPHLLVGTINLQESGVLASASFITLDVLGRTAGL